MTPLLVAVLDLQLLQKTVRISIGRLHCLSVKNCDYPNLVRNHEKSCMKHDWIFSTVSNLDFDVAIANRNGLREPITHGGQDKTEI